MLQSFQKLERSVKGQKDPNEDDREAGSNKDEDENEGAASKSGENEGGDAEDLDKKS
jgi:hypothetical protein